MALGSVDDALGEHIEVRATVGHGHSVLAWHAAGEFGADRVAWVERPDGLFPANRLFFAEIKDIRSSPQCST